ncbi:MAG TPA: hypothetical protein VHA52_10535 [Candidatus Babeliaceae bacterium]|nr:hypothetical protein [Candidatus Babeliaceae bacterium]
MNATHAQNLTEFLFLCIPAYVCLSVANKVWDRNQNRKVALAKHAMRHYIHTGEKNREFPTLGGTLISTAERLRSDYVEYERRRKENAAIDIGFSLFCECPRCGTVDSHNLTGNMAGRECKNCGYIWHVPG